jgi:hypothetical protein
MGEDFYQIIKYLFEADAFVNLRRAQGLLAAAEEAEAPTLVNRAARFMREHRVRSSPRELRWILEKLRAEDEQHETRLSLVELSEEFVRDVTYFINHPEEGNT